MESTTIPVITVEPPDTPSPPSTEDACSTTSDNLPSYFDRAPKHDFALQGFQTQDALNKLVHALSVHDIQQHLNSVRSLTSLGPFNAYDPNRTEPSSLLTSLSNPNSFTHTSAESGTKLRVEVFPPQQEGLGLGLGLGEDKAQEETKLEDTESDGTVKGMEGIVEKKKKKKSKKKKKKSGGVRKDEDVVEIEEPEVQAGIVVLTEEPSAAKVQPNSVIEESTTLIPPPVHSQTVDGDENTFVDPIAELLPITIPDTVDPLEKNQGSRKPETPGSDTTAFPTPQISITVLKPDESLFSSPEHVSYQLPSDPETDQEVLVRMPVITVQPPTRPSSEDTDSSTETPPDQETSSVAHSTPSTQAPATPPPDPCESDDLVAILTTDSPPSSERAYPLQDSWCLWFSDTSDTRMRQTRRHVESPSPSADVYSHGLCKIFTTGDLQHFAGTWKALRRRIAERQGRDIEPTGQPMKRGTEGLGVQVLGDDNNFHFFLDGVQPMWEDPMCAHGGKVMLSNSPTVLDMVFYETVLLLIGGSLYDHCPAPSGSNARVLGAVISKRKVATRVEIWLGGGEVLPLSWISSVTQFLAGYFPSHRVYPYKAFHR
ncbi:translation initiation factor eIF 4e-like domain-containing protein [Naematelia encephala]|uniref:Translation initiation factor eIF 4e-like domain-containing protein n=1 Tax=Naematelia encephala TaxID=71784 RepID=A0A1Y2B0B8_9TREE|nr:translation initiation factor eIF 4e-like domain-containing protein [Naematelia encephala]